MIWSKETYSDGEYETYEAEYDEYGNVIWEIEEEWPDEDYWRYDYEYEYDVKGNITKEVCSSSWISYTVTYSDYNLYYNPYAK